METPSRGRPSERSLCERSLCERSLSASSPSTSRSQKSRAIKKERERLAQAGIVFPSPARGRPRLDAPTPKALYQRKSRATKAIALANQGIELPPPTRGRPKVEDKVAYDMSSLNPLNWMSPSSTKNNNQEDTMSNQEERILSVDELKRLSLQKLLKRQEEEGALQKAEEATRLEDAKSRMEDAKGRTKAEDARKLGKQYNIQLESAIETASERLFGPAPIGASTSTDSTSSISNASSFGSTPFDKDDKLSAMSQGEYNMTFMQLVGQLCMELSAKTLERHLACGYVIRFLCFGYVEADYLDSLLACEAAEVQFALKNAAELLLVKPKEIKDCVHRYLDSLVKDVTKSKETGEKVVVYYRKYDSKTGVLTLVKSQVIEAKFHYDKSGKVSFDVAIKPAGGDVVDTIMSRIQKEVHTMP